MKRDGLMSSERTILTNETYQQPLLDSIALMAIYHRPLSTHLVPDPDFSKAILLPPPPIIPRKHGPGNVGFVNQEAETNYDYSDVLALYHALIEIKQKH
ncbi:hypothetical protein O181_105683 [Austropuccinia psidii MF-1]|uniref:Uncharacterized protein n=1 Tax=Austropuccinia psidii MF-1 TaxID=1389203 RepID=A0A9Q3PL84_9BASI|nr:hypothetical protein [Austropuccinia psidii MF-1]